MNAVFRNIVPPLLALVSLAACCVSLGAQARPLPAPRNHHLKGPVRSARSLDGSLKAATSKAIYRPEHTQSGNVAFDNPAQKMGAILSREGLLVRTGLGRSKSAHLSLTSVGYGKQTSVLPTANPRIEGERVSFNRGAVTEWYLNTPRGIEQGFTLAARPAHGSSSAGLSLRLNVSGGLRANLMPSRKGVHLAGSGVNLIYDDLSAFDARHHALPADMAVYGKEIRLQVDDRTAVYPITIDPLVEQQELIASDGQTIDIFGQAVAISGDTAVVGAPNANNIAGAAYVFVRSGDQWTQQARLDASMASVPNPSNAPEFGESVAIYGNTIAIGAPSDQDPSAPGHVYLFQRTGTTWTFQTDGTQETPGDDFGWSVSLYGTHLAVGAPGNGAGSVYEYNYAGGFWFYQAAFSGTSTSYNGFAATVATSDSVLAVWDQANSTVNVYIYTGSWNLYTVLTDPGPNPDPSDAFGIALAVDGPTGSIAIGAPGGNNVVGVAYYYPSSSSWSTYAYLTSADGYPGDAFGSSVAVQNNTLVAGAAGWDDGSGTGEGSVYIFTSSFSIWSQTDQIWGGDYLLGDTVGFGSSVAMDGNTVFVGAPSSGAFTGSAYAFVPAALPIAGDDFYQTPNDVTFTVSAANGVLANDYDLGTGNFTAQLVSSTTNGQLILYSDGSFIYNPNTGFVGYDSFQYVAHDDQGNSNTATVTLAVQAPTAMNVPNVTCNEGASATLKASISVGTTYNPKKPIAGLQIDFYVDGVQIGSAYTNGKGMATLAYTPPTPGNHNVDAVWTGSDTYAPSTGYGAIIVRNKTALTMSPDYATVGQGAIPSGYLTRNFDGQALVGLTVTLSLNGKKVGSSVSDFNGYIAFNVGKQLHAGTFTYQAAFKGDNYNQACSAPLTLTVSAANTATTVSNAAGAIGGTVTLKAKVTEQVGLTGLAGVAVSFSINGSTVGMAATINGGIATLVYRIPKSLPVGVNALSAQFAGSSDYNASISTNAKLTVSSGTTVSVANTSGSVGQTVTLAAKLLTSPGGRGVSGETLSFLVDGNAAGSAVTDGSGNASHSYKIPNGTASGAHTITVKHKASSLYGTSSGSGTLTVH